MVKNMSEHMIEEMIERFLEHGKPEAMVDTLTTVGIELLQYLMKGGGKLIKKLFMVFKNSYKEVIDFLNDGNEVEKEMEKINKKMNGVDYTFIEGEDDK